MVNIRMAVKKDYKQLVATCYRPVNGEWWKVHLQPWSKYVGEINFVKCVAEFTGATALQWVRMHHMVSFSEHGDEEMS